MRQQNSDDPGAIRLTSWKEIAAFLGRDQRTAKRWEGSRGLPVRRVPGRGRAAVFAYPHELRAWLDGVSTVETGGSQEPDGTPAPGIGPPPSSATPKRVLPVAALLAVLAVVLIVAGLAALLWTGRNSATPTTILSEGSHNAAAVTYYQSGLHAWQTRSPCRPSTGYRRFHERHTRRSSLCAALHGSRQHLQSDVRVHRNVIQRGVWQSCRFRQTCNLPK